MNKTIIAQDHVRAGYIMKYENVVQNGSKWLGVQLIITLKHTITKYTKKSQYFPVKIFFIQNFKTETVGH